MLELKFTKQFQKDVKLQIRRRKDILKLRAAIEALAHGGPIPAKLKDHALSGDFSGFRECHIESDWLIIYLNNTETLHLIRTGTHSDLFG